MADVNFLNIPYHQQDDPEYCGAATAQMILAALGAGDLRQPDLYEENRAAGLGGMSASHLQNVLNTKLATLPGNTVQFAICQDGDPETACGRIADSVAKGVPVAAVVWGDAHWVTVVGTVTAPPVPGSKPAVLGFFINNSAPVTAYLSNTTATFRMPPPQHETGDHCGDGNVQGSKYVYVTKEAWLEHYWRYPYDHVNPPAYLTVVANPSLPTVTVRTAAVRPRVRMDLVSGDNEVTARIRSAIAQHGLGSAGPLTAILSPPDFGTVESPKSGGYSVRLFSAANEWCGNAYADSFGRFMGIESPRSETPTPDENGSRFLGLEDTVLQYVDVIDQVPGQPTRKRRYAKTRALVPGGIYYVRVPDGMPPDADVAPLDRGIPQRARPSPPIRRLAVAVRASYDRFTRWLHRRLSVR